MRAELEAELKRIWIVPEFYDRKRRKEILGPLPDQEKWAKEQMKVDAARAANGFPANLRPCYQSALLTKQQEFHLFRQFNYFKYLANNRLACGHLKEAKDYLAKARVVRNKITECNVRLAPNVVKFNPDNEDLLAEAYAGVMKAVDYFDYRRGFKFSTYCTWVLKKNSYKQWSDSQRKQLPLLSGEFDDAETRDMGYEEEVRHNELKSVVQRLLAKLGDREAFVLRHRFGLDGHEELTLKEIGEKLSVSKERVRQLERRGLDVISSIDGTSDLFMASEFHGTDSGI